jgi:hypothetical protein
MDFSSMKVKDLKRIATDFRKYHSIQSVSKMKKAQLVEELNKRFILQGEKLYLKQDYDDLKPQPQAAQRQHAEAPQSQAEKRLQQSVIDIQNRLNYSKDSAFAKRLRGNH